MVMAEGGPGDTGGEEQVRAPGRRARRGSGWRHTRAWLLGLRASRSYVFVLLFVVIAFIFTATAPPDRWATAVLVLIMSVTLLLALWTSRAAPLSLRIGVPALAIGVAVAQLVHEDEALSSTSGVLSGLLVVATILVIGRGVVSHPVVDAQSVIGGITIYILLGMLYVFIYTVIAVIGDAPFFAQGTDGTVGLRLYFSFTTLTTVGFGDYTAASDLGHTLAVTEALMGQVYLVTVVALLVSRLRPKDRSRRGGGDVS